MTLSEERLPAGRPVVREQLAETEEAVVQKLEDQRLLTGASDTVRLAHERLIIAWPTLAQAVAERMRTSSYRRGSSVGQRLESADGGLLGREAVGVASVWLDQRADIQLSPGHRR